MAIAWQVKVMCYILKSSIPVDVRSFDLTTVMNQANIELQNYVKTKKRENHILTQLYAPGTASVDIVSSFQAIRDKHVDAALKRLAEFPQNDATNALCNIASALKY